MTYVVCQTSRCQQTYPLEFFGEITVNTKDVSCEKCGGILVDNEGKANFSQNSTVIPVVTIEEVEKQRDSTLKEKRRLLKELKKEIKELEEEEN
ncbi:MAG TPA: hypothetical protein VI423_03070 [Paenisporosarcina sp.]|nr:hypothetical protein [Paenisporosarcina sp.]